MPRLQRFRLTAIFWFFNKLNILIIKTAKPYGRHTIWCETRVNTTKGPSNSREDTDGRVRSDVATCHREARSEPSVRSCRSRSLLASWVVVGDRKRDPSATLAICGALLGPTRKTQQILATKILHGEE